MGICRGFVIFVLIFIFLASLVQIAYSIYQTVGFMQKPSNYIMLCIDPYKGEGDGSNFETQYKNCNGTYAFLTEEYKLETEGFLNQTSSNNANNTNELIILKRQINQTCFIQWASMSPRGINHDQLNPLFIEQKIIKPKEFNSLKILAACLQSISILLLILGVLTEYSAYFPNLETLNSLRRKFDHISLFVIITDMTLVTFLSIMNLNYSQQCIEKSFLINIIKSILFWTVFPYGGFLLVLLAMCVMVCCGKCKNCCFLNFIVILGCISFVALLAIVILSFINLFITSPIPIIAILAAKILAQLSFKFINCFKYQVDSLILSRYNQGESRYTSKKSNKISQIQKSTDNIVHK